MKPLLILMITSLFFMGCSTLNFGGDARTSSTYVSKGSEVTASSKSTDTAGSQSEIDMKIEELKQENDSRIINR